MTVRFSGGRLVALVALFSTAAALAASPGRADAPPIPNALAPEPDLRDLWRIAIART